MKYELPWWKNVHRWGQTNLTEIDPHDCDLDFWREQWKRTRIQGVIVNAGGIVAYYPSRYGLQYRAAYLGDRDFYKEFSDAARQEGLAVVARMDLSRCTEEVYAAHPDWFCRDSKGAPLTSNGRYYSCVSSGYYREFIPKILTEIIEKYHPDGFTDNSWSGLGRNTICYCDNCRTQFHAAAALDLPKAVDWSDPAYIAWIRWSLNERIRNWDLFNRVTQSAGGPDCLWQGMLHADPNHAGGSLRDLHALCGRSKIIFTDHQGRDPFNGFSQNALNGALLRMASPSENTLVPESIANYVRGDKAFRLAANPAAESRMWLIDGISGGISPWYHHIGGGQLDRRQFDTPIPVFQWHAQNDAYLYDRRDLSTVGLVWSQENADFFGRDRVHERVAQPMRGFHHALLRGRIPFLPVNARDIPRDLSRLRALILPNLAILGAEARASILDFVRGGGGLVVTGQTDMADENGAPRPESPLLSALGITPTGPAFGAASRAAASWEHYEAHNYLLLPDTDRHALLAGFEKTDILPFGGMVQPVRAEENYERVAGYVPAFPIYPPEFSYVRERRPEIGTIYAGKVGKGRVVYFAANIDACCGAGLLPDHAELLAAAVRWAHDAAFSLRVEGPGTLDVRAYRQQNRVIVHIVNLSGADRHGYLEETLPVGPVRVHVPGAYAAVPRAELRVFGGLADVERDGDGVCVTAPRVNDHELIVIKDEDGRKS